MSFFIFLKRKVAWKFNFVGRQVAWRIFQGVFREEKVKGYPNMPSNKGVTNVKNVWINRKLTSEFNIPGITPTWIISTWGSRWGQEVWMTFLDSCGLLWPGTASWPLHHSGPTEVLNIKKIWQFFEIFPTLTDLCHILPLLQFMATDWEHLIESGHYKRIIDFKGEIIVWTWSVQFHCPLPPAPWNCPFHSVLNTENFCHEEEKNYHTKYLHNCRVMTDIICLRRVLRSHIILI